MGTVNFNGDSIIDDYDDEYDSIWEFKTQEQQDEEDAYIDSRGGIDKCMCCGRYCYGDELNQYQVHEKGCVNPNEY